MRHWIAMLVLLAVATTPALACDAPPRLLPDFTESPAKTDTDRARQTHLAQEAATLSPPEGAPACPVTIRLAAAPAGDMAAYGAQGFALARAGPDYRVTAATSLGRLYGFYEVLDDLGFVFASTQDTARPATTRPRSAEGDGEIITPLIATRGLWTFGEGLDPAFLLWAGRNRYNLLGGRYPGGEALWGIYGMHRWAGGHDVLSTLVPSDADAGDGQTLIEAHPDWYGQRQWAFWRRAKNPLPAGADVYRNPCFGNPEFVDHFADALAQSLLDGVYRNVDVLNIWPSDHAAFTREGSCDPAPGAQSDLDDLVFFYNRAVARLSEDAALRAAGRRVTIAGIGYYGTYDLSGTTLTLESGAGPVRYRHYFYNNVRSYLTGLFDPGSSVNARLMGMQDATIDAHALPRFGAVEYYGYSVYLDMTSPQTRLLADEIRTQHARGMDDWAYMHPRWPASPFHGALDYNLARLLFNDEAPEASLAHYVAAAHGDATLTAGFDAYEAALAGIAEARGPATSLWLVVMSDRFWADPPLDARTLRRVAAALLMGTPTDLPPLRLRDWPMARFDGPGLRRTLGDLATLEDQFARANRPALAAETARTRLLLDTVAAAADQRLAANDAPACRAAAARFGADLAALEDLPFPAKATLFGGKREILDGLGRIHADYIADACP